MGQAAFGRFNPDRIAVGAGAEVYVDAIIGYVVPFTLRVGWAYGFMEGGDHQLYWLLGSPF